MTTGLLTLLLTLGVGATPSDVFTIRSHNLEIPIRIDDARRAEFRELELHVSTDMGRTWTLAGRANPADRAFPFRSKGDGLYWFGVCAIDKNGRRDPEDIATAKPALKVLIDTAHPALQVVAIDRVGEEVQVAWECSDGQADPASLRLEYRPAAAEPTAVWTPVPIEPRLNGTYRFRPVHGGALTLRMQITDSAGAPATVVKDVPAGTATAVPPPITTVYQNPPPAAPAPAPGIQQATSVAPPPPPPVAPLTAMPNMVAPVPVAPEAPSPMPAAVPAGPTPPAETSTGPAPLAPLRPMGDAAPRTGPSELPTPPAAPPLSNGHVGLSKVEHVRDRRVPIDFEVDRRGPSGVKKIEVYVTTDDGQSWYKYSETANTVSPLQLDLPPKDGLFGFCMVLYSGVGQSEGPPQRGTEPQFRIFVDRTLPQVELYSPVMDPSQSNALLLRYKATDANLVADSVSLSWRARPDQPWQPLSTGPTRSTEFKDVNECSWTLPPDVPNSVYLRVTARDQAGNMAEYVARDPVTVDLNKPVARFKGILMSNVRRP